MSTPAIKKALTIEEIFAQSDRERRLYELREKGLHDLATIRATGREAPPPQTCINAFPPPVHRGCRPARAVSAR